MKIRKRITIDEDLHNAAVEYAKLDNRTFSELVRESLGQIMRRYPRKPPEYLIEENRELEAKAGQDK